MLNTRMASIGRWLFLLMLVVMSCPPIASAADAMVGGAPPKPWWFWPIILFFFLSDFGILAVMAGVGGGVLYVPLVSGFFPFHIDFVRGIGLMVALAGALAAGPGLLRRNLANLRLALPVALIASACSIAGAMLGLYLSRLNPNLIQSLSGRYHCRYRLFAVVFEEHRKPVVTKQDAIGLALGLQGVYWDDGARESVEWKTHRTLLGLFMFILIGLLAGMFGLGAGWANVPVLNLLMGVPLKVSVATSKFLLSITDTSAAWIYLNRGCVIPLIAVPSIVGLMLGSILGVRILAVAKPKFIRYMVISVLFFAGLKALDKGLGLGFLGYTAHFPQTIQKERVIMAAMDKQSLKPIREQIIYANLLLIGMLTGIIIMIVTYRFM
jgi:uncharacterized membrane protein YfcA